eukprot:TRINITY_DN3047_c0_g1_i15.p1 TRINITY_DN3047_c0_g1~~TRINITY_DN3047_c0_g1_i15.p1  ORF type:complete len:171 (+),score=58.52 TRINITY_DN3047_c0_g1_i15:65-577(+)
MCIRDRLGPYGVVNEKKKIPRIFLKLLGHKENVVKMVSDKRQSVCMEVELKAGQYTVISKVKSKNSSKMFGVNISCYGVDYVIFGQMIAKDVGYIKQDLKDGRNFPVMPYEKVKFVKEAEDSEEEEDNEANEYSEQDDEDEDEEEEEAEDEDEDEEAEDDEEEDDYDDDD